MERIEYLAKNMSRKQKELYAKICELKQFRAIRQNIKTCKVLLQFGLIKQDPRSDNKNDYVLECEPLQISVIEKLPLKKDIVEEIKPWTVINETIEENAKPKFKRAAPDHTNLSREDHVSKWLSLPGIEAGAKEMIRLKHLNELQMHYIMGNHTQKTIQQLAEHLKVEKFMVKLFCQANNIEPYVIPKKKKPKDDYHCIPHERKLRMQKVGYNGPQKKTA